MGYCILHLFSFTPITQAGAGGRAPDSCQRSWPRCPVWQHTFVSRSADSRGAVVSYWRKYVYEVLVNRLGGLNLLRTSVVRLTDRPDMTLDVYRGRKPTTQQQQNQLPRDKQRDREQQTLLKSISSHRE